MSIGTDAMTALAIGVGIGLGICTVAVVTVLGAIADRLERIAEALEDERPKS